MIEEEKEAADFMNENDAAPENLVHREFNHPPEEEKKANVSECRSSEDSGFDVDLSIEDVVNEDEELKVEKLVEIEKTRADINTLISVPEASGQKEEVEPRIEMIEEEKEAADFMNENDAAPENLVHREINHPPEEEKKANLNESQSSEGSGFDINSIKDAVHDDVELRSGET